MPQIIETTLLVLLIFLVGCGIGYLLRMPGFRSESMEPESRKSDRSGAGAATVDVDADSTKAKAAEVAERTESDAPAAVVAPGQEAEEAKPAATASSGEAAEADDAPAPSGPADGKPELLDAPRGGTKDNLRKIKGVGPKIETKLNELGIYHVDQIAGWDRKNIEWVDEQLAFHGRINREEWVSQAKDLANKG